MPELLDPQLPLVFATVLRQADFLDLAEHAVEVSVVLTVQGRFIGEQTTVNATRTKTYGGIAHLGFQVQLHGGALLVLRVWLQTQQ
jgi:hypothetical protein